MKTHLGVVADRCVVVDDGSRIHNHVVTYLCTCLDDGSGQDHSSFSHVRLRRDARMWGDDRCNPSAGVPHGFEGRLPGRVIAYGDHETVRDVLGPRPEDREAVDR